MSNKLTGIVRVKGVNQTVNDKFNKLDFVVTVPGEYPQHISFQITQDRVRQMDAIKVGDAVTVSFNLRGREWISPQGEIKYFNTLEAWKVEKEAGTQTDEPQTEAQQDIANHFNNPAPSKVDHIASPSDDLPF